MSSTQMNSSRIVAKRIKISYKDADFSYLLSNGNDVKIVENSESCDGIGGVVWDGSLLMAVAVLEKISMIQSSSSGNGNKLHLLELGAGCGICSIIFQSILSSSILLSDRAANYSRITCTDRCIDLALDNVDLYTAACIATSTSTATSDSIAKPDILKCMPLTWGNEREICDIISDNKNKMVDVILGVEVACLRNQQNDLVLTIDKLTHDASIMFITFDSTPMPNNVSAEKEFNSKVDAAGWLHAVVFTGRIRWVPSTTDKSICDAYYEDLTHMYRNDLHRIAIDETYESHECKSINVKQLSQSMVEDRSGGTCKGDDNDIEVHHIVMYYKVDAVKYCDCCNMSFYSCT